MKELKAPQGYKYWDGENLPASVIIIPEYISEDRYRLITLEEAEAIENPQEEVQGKEN